MTIKDKKNKKILRQLVVNNVAFILILSVVLIIWFLISSFFGGSKGYIEAKITIPRGAGTKAIARILKENKIITNEFVFVNESKKKGYDGKYKYGDFILNNQMTREELMEALNTNGSFESGNRFTIPEGYTLKQIAERLEEQGFTTREDFYNAAKRTDYDYPFLANLPKNNDFYLEGYLFPNTYEVRKGAGVEEIIEKMLDGFAAQYDPSHEEMAKKLGYSYHEIVIIASMIEREVAREDERRRVAGVIYNRLAKRELLQFCSTVQYILGEPHAKLYEADLQIDSPYNTYKYTGLPVGPISNPGSASILAALDPEKHDYFYFVLMDDQTGQHYFSKTFLEHVNAKNRYLAE